MLLLVTCPALAQTWTSGLFTHPPAPELKLQDLYGAPLSLNEYQGRVVVVTFIDKKSQTEAISWTERLPEDYLGDERVVFINVIFPGGISFLVPRVKVVERLRSEITSVRAQLRASMTPEQRTRLENSTIRWAADWKRRHSARWGVVRHRVNVFIVSPDGRLRETLRGMTPATAEILERNLDILLKRAAPRQAKGGPE